MADCENDNCLSPDISYQSKEATSAKLGFGEICIADESKLRFYLIRDVSTFEGSEVNIDDPNNPGGTEGDATGTFSYLPGPYRKTLSKSYNARQKSTVNRNSGAIHHSFDGTTTATETVLDDRKAIRNTADGWRVVTLSRYSWNHTDEQLSTITSPEGDVGRVTSHSTADSSWVLLESNNSNDVPGPKESHNVWDSTRTITDIWTAPGATVDCSGTHSRVEENPVLDGKQDYTEVTLSDEFTDDDLVSRVRGLMEQEPWRPLYRTAVTRWRVGNSRLTMRKLWVEFTFGTEAGRFYTVAWTENTVTEDGMFNAVSKSRTVRGTGGTQSISIIVEPPATSGVTFLSDIRVCAEPANLAANSGGSTAGTVACCGDGAGKAAGEANISLGAGPTLTLGLGDGGFGIAAGRLTMGLGAPSPLTGDVHSLTISAASEDVETITDSAGAIGQVKAPQRLIEVERINGHSFGLHLFAATELVRTGPRYSTNGLTELAAFWVTTPAASTGDLGLVEILENRGGGLKTNVFSFDPVSRGWSWKRPGGLSEERVWANWDADATHLTQFRQIVNPVDGNIAYHEEFDYEVTGSDDNARTLLMEHRVGTGPNRLRTRYGYNVDRNRVISRRDPYGGWFKYEYDNRGRKTSILSCFRNLAFESPVNLDEASWVREHTFNYSPVDSSDDGLGLPSLARDEAELLGSIVVSRTKRVVHRDPVRKTVDWIRVYRLGADTAPLSDPGNLVSETQFFTEGPATGRPRSVRNPDGTMQFFDYADNAGLRTITTQSGWPDSGSTKIIQGTRTTTALNRAGQVISGETKDTASGLVTASVVYDNLDSRGRPQRRRDVLSGLVEWSNYGCCQLESSVSREGIVTSYVYDPLGRTVATTTAGITTWTTYDAAGNVTKVERQGSTGASISLSASGYDDAGRLIWMRGPLGASTTYQENLGTGRLVKTITEATGTSEASARVEKYYSDGDLEETGGSAGNPTRYQSGFLVNNGSFSQYKNTIKLTADGTTTGTNEWALNVNDFLGRCVKTIYADGTPNTLTDNAFSRAEYDSKGRLWRQTDPDGVVTLYQQLGHGDRLTCIDVNRNGQIDLAGPDRVTRTISEVVSEYGTVTRRTSTSEYRLAGNAAPVVQSVSSSAVDGLHSWTITTGVANPMESHTGFGGSGLRFVTNKFPDGSYTVDTSQNGLLLSSVRKSADQIQLSKESFGYDLFGRRTKSTDARNGATLYTYDNADQVVTVTAPAPGTGQAAPTTTTVYDSMGRTKQTVEPDGATVYREYFPTGLLKKVSGSRTFPIEYSYDSQGRTRTMTTWQNKADSMGAATTVWNYNPYRGWLDNKRYADGKGPDYTYTLGGRTKTRLWARKNANSQRVTTVWSYGFESANGPEDVPIRNDSADITSVAYVNDPQNTPAVVYSYDRCGHPTTVTRGATITTRTYNAVGDILSENWAGNGTTLNGLSLTLSYDPYLRRQSAVAKSGTAALASVSYSYDTASRLATVGDGTYSATYGYLANSMLPNTVTLRQGNVLRLTTTRYFDFLNRLYQVNSIPAGVGQSIMNYRYGYNDAGQRITLNMPDGSDWRYQYDRLGQLLVGRRFWADGTPVAGQQFEYAFDDIGNRKVASTGGDGSGTNLRVNTYTQKPNGLNQYQSRTVPPYVDVTGVAQIGVTPTINTTLSPDARQGEYFWKSLNVPNNAGPQWADVKINVPGGIEQAGKILVPPATQLFSYDDDGNLLSDGVWNYTWDAENRLVSLQNVTVSSLAIPGRRKVTFEYDEQSRRIGKKVYLWSGSGYATSPATQTKFLFDGWNVVAELDGGNSLVRSYLWGNDLSGTLEGVGGVGGLLAVKPSGYPAQFVIYDGNGNVTGLVDGSNGLGSAIYEYGPFGESIRVSGNQAKTNPFRFSTKYNDEETELLYYGYRFYSPAFGRWINRDPSGETRRDSLYSVVSNNTINNIDLLGLYQPDFHFYTIYYILRSLCFTRDEAWNGAFASEFIDENPSTEPLWTTPANRAFWHFHGSSPNVAVVRNPPDLMDEIARLGEAARNSSSQDSMINLGIRLHTYADSWSHEGFTAWHNDKINRRTGSGRPNIGHADAAQDGEAPDLPFNDIDKAEEAARMIRLTVGSKCENCFDESELNRFIDDVRRGFGRRTQNGKNGWLIRNQLWRTIIQERFGDTIAYPF